MKNTVAKRMIDSPGHFLQQMVVVKADFVNIKQSLVEHNRALHGVTEISLYAAKLTDYNPHVLSAETLCGYLFEWQ
jgi:hypothetical protein